MITSGYTYGARFRSRPYPTTAFIEKRFDRSVLLNDRRFEFNIASHRISKTQNLKHGNLISAILLSH